MPAFPFTKPASPGKRKPGGALVNCVVFSPAR
jgi:hypothetical protein